MKVEMWKRGEEFAELKIGVCGGVGRDGLGPSPTREPMMCRRGGSKTRPPKSCENRPIFLKSSLFCGRPQGPPLQEHRRITVGATLAVARQPHLQIQI